MRISRLAVATPGCRPVTMIVSPLSLDWEGGRGEMGEGGRREGMESNGEKSKSTKPQQETEA